MFNNVAFTKTEISVFKAIINTIVIPAIIFIAGLVFGAKEWALLSGLSYTLFPALFYAFTIREEKRENGEWFFNFWSIVLLLFTIYGMLISIGSFSS